MCALVAVARAIADGVDAHKMPHRPVQTPQQRKPLQDGATATADGNSTLAAWKQHGYPMPDDTAEGSMPDVKMLYEYVHFAAQLS